MGDLTGQTVGDYRILSSIGRGGMATIYRAYQPSLDRYVAVKVIDPYMASDSDFTTRFRREAQTIAKLQHPNLVTLYECNIVGGLCLLVTEFIEGPSLSTFISEKHIAQEPIALSTAVATVLDIALALDYAHRAGVVHRDVKPSNILLAPGGRAVLADLGVGNMMANTSDSNSAAALFGTPQYMAPEVIQGRTPDSRADIYALGVTLYELVTGQVPFDADTPMAVLIRHINAPMPTPSLKRPDLPLTLEKVILRSTEKNPADRFQTATEMVVALETSRQDLPADQREMSPASGVMVEDQSRVHKFLVTYFNKNELRSLCFEMGIEYENFPDDLDGLSRELVRYCVRHDQFERMKETIQNLRPGIMLS